MRELRKACGLLAGLAALSQAFGQPSQPEYWTWHGPWHMWGGMGFWWLFPILMLGFVVFCAWFIVRGPWSHGHWRSHGDATTSAHRILNERFARGEISKEEFEEKKALLKRE